MMNRRAAFREVDTNLYLDLIGNARIQEMIRSGRLYIEYTTDDYGTLTVISAFKAEEAYFEALQIVCSMMYKAYSRNNLGA